MKKIVWVPVMVVSGGCCFETPWVHRPSLLVSKVRQMIASSPARRESIVFDTACDRVVHFSGDCGIVVCGIDAVERIVSTEIRVLGRWRQWQVV